MSGVICSEDHCTECSGIVLRTYSELRDLGYDDPKAFQSAVRVLKLRHPGHTHDYYLGLAAKWIAAASESRFKNFQD